ncbi:MAG: LAGLIDADG family homing endonuclease, partial [Clostridia bacterium]
MNLNEKQIEAIQHMDGPCVVTSCPGSGKCITGESLIISNAILVSEIKDNAVKDIIGVKTEDLSNIDLQQSKISEFVDSGYQKTVKIKTKNGYSIEGTYHHPIVIINKLGKFEWKHLDDIEIGDICPIWSNREKFNYEIDDKFYLMGLLLGDGCLTGAKSRKTISFHSEQNNISDKFCEIVNRIYGYEIHKLKDKRRKNLYSFNINKKGITQQILETFGDVAHGACEKYLTKEMLIGSKGQIASLIMGLFDTDGHVNLTTCEIMLCSKKMIDQLHVLLLHYGVFSHKTIKVINGKDYYRLSIYGNDYRRFVENIGFYHEKKKKISLLILEKNKNSNKIIPNVKNLIGNIVKELSLTKKSWYSQKYQHLIEKDGATLRLARQKSFSKNGRNITEDTILRIKNVFEDNNYTDKTFEYIKQLNGFSYSEVIEKEYSTEKKHVFDYVVPVSHNFIANGFINHNTSVLVERTINLINNGVRPQNILCITFTNKA